jgi:hypothetical protein
VVAHSVVGSTRSLVWWFDPAGTRSADFVARELADTFVRGLVADRPGTLPAAVVADLAALRSSLDALQRSLTIAAP